MALKWSREEIDKLIVCIEQNPCLYAVKSAEYLDRVKKAHVFDYILGELKKTNDRMTIPEIKRKWRVLRTQFMQEVRAIEQSKKSGAGSADVYIPKLWCFQQMQFLKIHSKNRKSFNNIQVIAEDGTQKIADNDIENSQNINNIQITTDDDEESFIKEPPKKRQKTSNSNSDLRKDLNKFQMMLAKRKPEKKFAWLGNLVTNQMDMISAERQSDAAWEVQCLMRKLVQQDQQNTASTSSRKDILELSMQGIFEDEDFN